MANEIKTNYFDSKGKEYRLEDIVFNPMAQDYWIVKQYSKEEMENYETDCPYYLALWGDKDFDFIDIDEPDGFEIICSKDDPKYIKYLSDMQNELEKIKKQEKELDEESFDMKVTKLTNKELMEMALNQIEKETGFHIKDKKFGNCYFVFEDEEDSICHFHIKEIPGFIFAFWNTCRFDKIEDQMKNNRVLWSDYYSVHSRSELVFFTQFERDLDKFKPSYSGYLTGIFRQVYYERRNDETETHRIEEFYMDDLIDILNFMKKHPIKAYCHCGLNTNIWNSLPSYKYLWIFIKDAYYDFKYNMERKIKLKSQIKKALKFVKKLKCLNAVILDKGSCWSPRIEIYLRQIDDFSIEDYKHDSNIVDKFDDKHYSDISITYCGIDALADDITTKDLEKDKEYKDWFYEHPAKMNEPDYFEEDDEDKVLYYNVKKEGN